MGWNCHHTTHREPFRPTAHKLQSWQQPGRTFGSLGHSRRVTGSHVYPVNHKMAPAMDVITETLLFCDGNWLQSARIQLWLQRGRHLGATLGPRHNGQPLSAEAQSLDHPCVGTGGRGAQGSVPLVSAWPEPKERAYAGKRAQSTAHCTWQGQAGASQWLKSQGHIKAKWEQPLVMFFRFENTTGGLKPLQEEISCQV